MNRSTITQNLRIRAHVTHEQAKRCGAFSIRGKIVAYELRDVDNAGFHAYVTNAELIEISLTDTPANPNALVRSRHRAALKAYLETLGEQTDLTIGLWGLSSGSWMLRETIKAPVRAAPPYVAPRRPTQFSALVEAINR